MEYIVLLTLELIHITLKFFQLIAEPLVFIGIRISNAV